MAREKKNVHKVQMTEGKRNIIRMLLQSKSERSDNDDYRNGYKTKKVNSSMEIEVPQDRKFTFKPKMVKNVRKIFMILTGSSSSCMQKA